MTNPRSEPRESTLDYYSVLGVSKDAARDEIEARYRELVDHMASAAIPPTLREWANRETALLDEAYAVLSDPERRARLAGPPAAVTSGGAAARAEKPASALRALFNGVPWTLAAMGAALGIVVLVFVLGGGDILSGRGGGGDSPAAAQEGDVVAIDTERVAELVSLVQEDPNNTEAMFELGEMYFLAMEWQSSIDWLTRLVALEPNHVFARTDIGTANFNLGHFDVAKATWLAALEIAPDDVQLHYNMGFLYANVDPVDLQSATNEWAKVVQLAPGSDLAATAQVHLESLTAAASPEASPDTTAAPVGP